MDVLHPQHVVLVVVIPALNEEKTIAKVIDTIPTSIAGIDETKVVVVDDGSTDQTAALARDSGATVVSHRANRGVGAAFATGLDTALRLQADVIVNVDGDGQFDTADIPKLVKPILESGCGFVSCTRFGDPNNIPKMPGVKKWGNRMMCRLLNLVIGSSNFTDVSCGFRAYSRETALRLNLYGNFTYTQESFIDMASKGVRMTEVPLPVRGVREFGNSRIASNVWRYALQTMPIIARAVRDVQPLTFFGVIALFFLLVGVSQLGFVGIWWLTYQKTSPWSALITLGATCVILGIILTVLALIADQLGRSRKIHEQLLYYERQRFYRQFAVCDSETNRPISTTGRSTVPDTDVD